MTSPVHLEASASRLTTTGELEEEPWTSGASEGNDASLKASAVEHAQAIGAGHVFVLLLRDCYLINVLGRVKEVAERKGFLRNIGYKL
jgi:adenosine/AMP kinase